MSIEVGNTLPDVNLMRMGAEGPESVSLAALTAGRKVVIFAVPGAFTPTCHSAHLPGFVTAMDALKAKGVEAVICVSGNDPFVMGAWGETTGASAAGIEMLADADGSFARGLGMELDAPAAGLYGRTKRLALAAENGVVTVWHPETGRGCESSGGPAMVAAL